RRFIQISTNSATAHSLADASGYQSPNHHTGVANDAVVLPGDLAAVGVVDEFGPHVAATFTQGPHHGHSGHDAAHADVVLCDDVEQPPGISRGHRFQCQFVEPSIFGLDREVIHVAGDDEQ